jgi:hypothetical protein
MVIGTTIGMNTVIAPFIYVKADGAIVY